MYESIWTGMFGWLMVIILFVISLLVLSGKGDSIIAGFNTTSKEKKAEYNMKRLRPILGCGFSLMTVMLAIFMFFGGELPHYLHWVFPAGYLIVIGLMFFLSNALCRKKQS